MKKEMQSVRVDKDAAVGDDDDDEYADGGTDDCTDEDDCDDASTTTMSTVQLFMLPKCLTSTILSIPTPKCAAPDLKA